MHNIASANTKKFRNPTNYIPIDLEFYADHYSQKDYTLKSNVKKDIATMYHYIQKHCLEQKWKYSRIIFCVVKRFTSFIFCWNSSLKSGSSGVLVKKLENVSKYLLTSQFLT